MAKGIKFGRPFKLTPHQRQEVIAVVRLARRCRPSPAATT
jgi:hypothetical protein